MNRTQAPDGVLVINTLPALTLFAVLLTLGLLGFMLSLLIGLRAQARVNPFATYEALLPGQSLSSVIGYAQSTPSGYIICRADPPWVRQYLGQALQLVYRSTNDIDRPAVCEDTLEDDVFRKLILVIEADRVRELHLLSAGLRQEDLLLYWGVPDIIERLNNHQGYQLIWNRRTYLAGAYIEDADAIIERVILLAKNY